jgi:hypothetical protein
VLEGPDEGFGFEVQATATNRASITIITARASS